MFPNHWANKRLFVSPSGVFWDCDASLGFHRPKLSEAWCGYHGRMRPAEWSILLWNLSVSWDFHWCGDGALHGIFEILEAEVFHKPKTALCLLLLLFLGLFESSYLPSQFKNTFMHAIFHFASVTTMWSLRQTSEGLHVLPMWVLFWPNGPTGLNSEYNQMSPCLPWVL